MCFNGLAALFSIRMGVAPIPVAALLSGFQLIVVVITKMTFLEVPMVRSIFLVGPDVVVLVSPVVDSPFRAILRACRARADGRYKSRAGERAYQ